MQRLPNTSLVPFCVLANLLLGLGLPARGDDPPATAKAPVSLSSLLDEMTDRDALARWPSPAYQSKQASSYDRAQTDPHDAKTWFANKDFEQFIRVEQNGPRKEWVIMEHDGPGCVTRIWVPLWERRKNQVVRFYLDGSTKPAIEAKFNDLVSGTAFVHPPLAFVAWDTDDVRKQKFTAADPPKGLGGDLYLPIPFAKSCKITLDELPFYYCVNYRAYEPGTKVESFSMADCAETMTDHAKLINSLLETEHDSRIPTEGPRANISSFMLQDGILPGEEISLPAPLAHMRCANSPSRLLRRLLHRHYVRSSCRSNLMVRRPSGAQSANFLAAARG